MSSSIYSEPENTSSRILTDKVAADNKTAAHCTLALHRSGLRRTVLAVHPPASLHHSSFRSHNHARISPPPAPVVLFRSLSRLLLLSCFS